jgi:hypothetical protein
LKTLSLPVLPEDEAEWQLFAAMVDYDPRPALERIGVPVLVLFGADDPITPVEDSVTIFREAVPSGLVQVEVLAGAGHRLETGDPPTLVAGYLETCRASFSPRLAAKAARRSLQLGPHTRAKLRLNAARRQAGVMPSSHTIVDAVIWICWGAFAVVWIGGALYNARRSPHVRGS